MARLAQGEQDLTAHQRLVSELLAVPSYHDIAYRWQSAVTSWVILRYGLDYRGQSTSAHAYMHRVNRPRFCQSSGTGNRQIPCSKI